MAIDSNEEVFKYYRSLSGARRVELLYGLFNLSVPLEWRLFGQMIENHGRRDYLMLREDEQAVNSHKVLEEFCKHPWLETAAPSPPPSTTKLIVAPDSTGPNTTPAVSPNNNVAGHVGGGDVAIAHPQPKPAAGQQQPALLNGGGLSSTGTSPDISPRGSRNTSPAPSSTASSSTSTSDINAKPQQQLPVKQTAPIILGEQQSAPVPLQHNAIEKVVIYLCLLNSSNRICATTLASAFRHHLSVDSIKKHVERHGLLKDVPALQYPQQASSNHATSAQQRDVSPPVSSSVGSTSATTTTSSAMSRQAAGGGDSQPTQPAAAAKTVKLLDPKFVAEITLMFTIAMHHPAFSFDDQQQLSKQWLRVRNYFSSLLPPGYSFKYYEWGNANNTEKRRGCYHCGELGHATADCNKFLDSDEVDGTTTGQQSHDVVDQLRPTLTITSAGMLPYELYNDISAMYNHAVQFPMPYEHGVMQSFTKIRQYLESTPIASHPPHTAPPTANNVPYWAHSPHFPVAHAMPANSYPYTLTDAYAEPRYSTTTSSKREKSCYNCGAQGHFGDECQAETLEEATRASTYNLDYTPIVPPLHPPNMQTINRLPTPAIGAMPPPATALAIDPAVAGVVIPQPPVPTTNTMNGPTVPLVSTTAPPTTTTQPPPRLRSSMRPTRQPYDPSRLQNNYRNRQKQQYTNNYAA